MTDAQRLRARVLSALGAGMMITGMAPLACMSDEQAALEPDCAGAQVVCWQPYEAHFNAPLTPEPVSNPPPTFDENGCHVREEVADSCCNPAQTGPVFRDGECCYGFCTGACCGRPLIVEGSPRVAAVRARGDWAAELDGLKVTGLSTELRAELGRQWLNDARLEHASIASFARFVLDLLAFGAPAELVEGAQRAMADEIQHARICFALATAYQGEACGPGAMPLAGVQVSPSLREAAVAAVREGCVEETIAALHVRAQASAAREPALREILERIAADEERHAELAWRFVRWAIERGGSDVRAAVSSEFEQALCQRTAPELVAAADAEIEARGRLSQRTASRVRASALREVVAPCARALQTAAMPSA